MRNLFTIRLGTLFSFILDDHGLYIVIGSHDWFWNIGVLPSSIARLIVKDRSKPGTAVG